MLKKPIKLASSTRYTTNIVRYIEQKEPKTVLDFGCGIGNKLGRFLKQKYPNVEVYACDAQEIEAEGETTFMSFEEFKATTKTFDIIHASCLFHEVCAPSEFEQREIKGGPHTVDAQVLAEILQSKLSDGGTLIIEDFVKCNYQDFLNQHYFIKTLDKNKYQELFDRFYISLMVGNSIKSIKEDLKILHIERYEDLVQRLFFKNENLKQGEFKKLDEMGKIIVYLRRYRDHHMRHNQGIYEDLFNQTGFIIVKRYQDSALTTQWFLKKYSPEKIRKMLAHALRHKPEWYGLHLDVYGCADIKEIQELLQRKYHRSFTVKQLEELIGQGKQRFEIKDNKIRARYGHSLSNKIKKESSEPPEFLYHGTTIDASQEIKQRGLESMGRQYVHLSLDKKTAEEVAKRHSENIVILKIRAKQASQEGINFYDEKIIWLADDIPAKYIQIL